jgi:phage-related protein (TIGR01555 family)
MTKVNGVDVQARPETTPWEVVFDRMDQLTGFNGFELGGGDQGGGYGMAGRPGSGWVNHVTGMGTHRDKTAYGKYTGYAPIDLITLSNLYHGDDLSARIIDTPVEEEFRRPFKISVGDDNLNEELAEDLERLLLRERFAEARRWGSLFGGAWIVLGADDGQAASEPLRPEQLKRGVEWLQVVDRRFMWPISWYQEGPKAGTPDKYVLSQNWIGVAAGSYTIHESRMIQWPGVPTGQRERNLNASYDYSKLDRCWPHIRMYNTLWKGVELLITEGPTAVHSIAKLAQKMMAGQEDALRKRLAVVDFYRSMYRAVLVDKDEETFERQPLQLTGVPDILNQAAFRVASTAQIPTMILFGQDPSGLNATGDASLRWFWDKTSSNQGNIVAPRIKHLVKLLLIARGRGELLHKIAIDFEPLYTPTKLEQAQERKAVADADKVYVDAQVVTPEEVLLSRMQDRGIWSPDWSGVNREVREKMLKDVLDQLTASTDPPTVPEVGRGMPPQAKAVTGPPETPGKASGAQAGTQSAKE